MRPMPHKQPYAARCFIIRDSRYRLQEPHLCATEAIKVANMAVVDVQSKAPLSMSTSGRYSTAPIFENSCTSSSCARVGLPFSGNPITVMDCPKRAAILGITRTMFQVCLSSTIRTTTYASPQLRCRNPSENAD